MKGTGNDERADSDAVIPIGAQKIDLDLDSDAQRIAALALAEDGPDDLTTAVTVEPKLIGTGIIEFRDGGILAGSAYADAVVLACGLPLVTWKAQDGERLPAHSVAGVLRGPLTAILRAERPVLNLLQRASGIATATRRYVEAVAGTGARILHTRKTAPGLRQFDVRAVLTGGGFAHRLDLAHAVMVKDNHWLALTVEKKSLATAFEEARARAATALYVEVESEMQVETACAAGATRLLVDNQSPTVLRAWAAQARTLSPGIEIEATGGITLENVRQYAEAGADFISIGALTHSVRATDVAMEIQKGLRAED